MALDTKSVQTWVIEKQLVRDIFLRCLLKLGIGLEHKAEK
jgi:hypothetical protein